MSEETVEMNIRVDKETEEWFTGLQKKSKKYLANELLCKVLDADLAKKDAEKVIAENKILRDKLGKARTHIEQSRRMILSVVDIWDDGV